MDDISTRDKKGFYQELNSYLKELIRVETDWLANLANSAALLYLGMDTINWAGFYLHKNGGLVLGPFQGKPACVRIGMGKGVCGRSAEKREVQIVRDVHLFPGHIACDEASKSEIVLPIVTNGRLVGVLDIDSPIKARFDEEDAVGLGQFIAILDRYIAWP
ncbi:MAG TPA: GAF domain-containing protein [Bacillota bacterium]|nr:GAF domain-containing protein [Bacillota bacterium]